MKRFRRWIRSLFGWLKPWHKPFVRRWPVYEGGELVESNGKMYVILHPSLRVAGRPAGGLGGPTCYLALNSFGVMESINNWETRRLQ
jgi:hypothetical protein